MFLLLFFHPNSHFHHKTNLKERKRITVSLKNVIYVHEYCFGSFPFQIQRLAGFTTHVKKKKREIQLRIKIKERLQQKRSNNKNNIIWKDPLCTCILFTFFHLHLLTLSLDPPPHPPPQLFSFFCEQDSVNTTVTSLKL